MNRFLHILFLSAILAWPSLADAQGFTNQGKPFPIIWTRNSSAIGNGGSSQTILPPNANRKALFIQNPCSAAEDLFVDFGQNASATQSIDLPACGNLSLGIGIVSQQSVTVLGATTSHAFIAFEGN